jgi:hypothetical protein
VHREWKRRYGISFVGKIGSPSFASKRECNNKGQSSKKRGE